MSLERCWLLWICHVLGEHTGSSRKVEEINREVRNGTGTNPIALASVRAYGKSRGTRFRVEQTFVKEKDVRYEASSIGCVALSLTV